MGDLFADRLESSHGTLALGKATGRRKAPPKLPEGSVDVPKSRQFVGFDAYQKVIDSGVDIVILATPPAFRPAQLEAAVKAGKHVFIEKPVAVDPVGIRSIIASSELAAQKGLAIVAGTQRRHQAPYVETMKRIHDGAIGELVSAQCYWNMGTLWVHDRKPEYSDMEWQIRNWLYFTWLSGDHIVEQHVHNIDVVNWAFGGPPMTVYGMGGRAARKGEKHGNVYDHFCIEFEYPNKARTISTARQTANASGRVSERVVGEKGVSDCRGKIWSHEAGADGKPKLLWEYDGESPNPYVQEHTDLIASIRKGKPLNEGKRIAESTLSAIAARMSAYTGRHLKFDWALNSSKLDLVPKELKFGPNPVRPVAKPGTTQLT